MSEYYVVKYIDGEPIQVKKENATTNNTKGFNGCVWGPPCPTCYWSSGSINGCVAPRVYCRKQTGTPCPGW